MVFQSYAGALPLACLKVRIPYLEFFSALFSLSLSLSLLSSKYRGITRRNMQPCGVQSNPGGFRVGPVLRAGD